MKLPQGAIKRISVALLLDQSVRWEGTGKAMGSVKALAEKLKGKSVTHVNSTASGAEWRKCSTIWSL
jgi:hypothetical protein